eukprot:742514-Amphidinium_carterae.1
MGQVSYVSNILYRGHETVTRADVSKVPMLFHRSHLLSAHSWQQGQSHCGGRALPPWGVRRGECHLAPPPLSRGVRQGKGKGCLLGIA